MDIGNLKSLYQAMKMSADPRSMLIQLMQKNPQVMQAVQFIQQSGGDPEKAFYTLAKQKGVDPESILSQFR